ALMSGLSLNDLDGEDLSGADLSGQDLSGLRFRHVRFVDSDCSRTDFRGSDLSYADFTVASLRDAQLGGALMTGTKGFPAWAVSPTTEARTKRHRLYEHVFLARQDLAQSQVDALAEHAIQIVEDSGGKVVKTETWGLRS